MSLDINLDASAFAYCAADIKYTLELFELLRHKERNRKMEKFKVGDRVIGNKRANECYCFTKEGWCGTVTKVSASGRLEIEGQVFANHSTKFDDLDPDCFDLVEVVRKIVITNDGITTTAKLYSGNSTVKTAEAKCSRDDAFDFLIGARVAFDRLVGEKKPEPSKFPKEKLTTGVFGKTSNDMWFVVVGDSLIYQHDGFDYVAKVREDGSFTYYSIDLLVNAVSFQAAQSSSAKVIWQREKK